MADENTNEAKDGEEPHIGAWMSPGDAGVANKEEKKYQDCEAAVLANLEAMAAAKSAAMLGLPPRLPAAPPPPKDADAICIDSDSDGGNEGGGTAMPSSFVIREIRVWVNDTRPCSDGRRSRMPESRLIVNTSEVYAERKDDDPGSEVVALRFKNKSDDGADDSNDYMRIAVDSVHTREQESVFWDGVAKVVVVNLGLSRPAKCSHHSVRHAADDGEEADDDLSALVVAVELIPEAENSDPTAAGLKRWLAKSPAEQKDEAALRLGGIVLTNGDFSCLDPGEFLNDSIIDFFLKLINITIASPELREDFYIASTLFFQQLTSNNADSGEAAFQNVKRWRKTLSGGLLAHKFVAIPVNELNLHWWMVVVANPAEAFGDKYDEEQPPRIVCLDSMLEAPPHEERVEFLQNYLKREWQERQKEKEVKKQSRAENDDPADEENGSQVDEQDNLQMIDAEVPKQENGYDCGIFVLEFIMHLLQNREVLESIGMEDHWDWFEQDQVSFRREQFLDILEKLRDVARSKNELDVAKLLEDESLKSEVAAALIERPPPRDNDSSVRPEGAEEEHQDDPDEEMSFNEHGDGDEDKEPNGETDEDAENHEPVRKRPRPHNKLQESAIRENGMRDEKPDGLNKIKNDENDGESDVEKKTHGEQLQPVENDEGAANTSANANVGMDCSQT